MGYEPDMRAQSLRTGVTMTIGFLVSDISNPLLSEIALGAAIRFREAGYTMLLVNSGGQDAGDLAGLRLLRQRRVDALMASFTSEQSETTRAELAKIDVPVVVIDRDPLVGEKVSAVLSDHAVGVTAAAIHLLELGHRRIALVNGSMKVRPGRERAKALRDACRSVPDASVAVRSGSFTVEHGQRATDELLKADPPPTVIIAGSNQILIGVMRSVRTAGLHVPGDLSIVACDAVGMSEFLTPPLATVRRDPSAMGSAAAELLLRQIRGGPPGQTILATSFEPTISCGPPGNWRENAGRMSSSRRATRP
jgi:LacI family transcriptional regulator